MHIVYRHTNKLNGKSYVGFTPRTVKIDSSTFSDEQIANHAHYLMNTRWKSHLRSAKEGKRWTFSCAIRKYGIDGFTHDVLEICKTLDEVRVREQYWIQHHKSTTNLHGYNETSGGEGGKRTPEGAQRHKDAMNRPEVRAKNSATQKRIANTPEAKLKRSLLSKKIMSDPKIRELISHKTKESMWRPDVRARHLATQSDPNTKQRHAEATRKSWQNPQMRANKRLGWEASTKVKRHAVDQIDMKTDKVIATFISVSEACRLTNIHKSSMLNHLHGNQKHAGGFVWKYVDQTV